MRKRLTPFCTMSENLKYVLTLTIICFITASLLAGVYLLTQPTIIEQKEREEKLALKEVFPEAGYFEPQLKDGQTLYFKAYSSADKKMLLGYTFRAQAQGYSSDIETMAGMNREGKITAIRILAQNETPGLGANIAEVKALKTFWQAIKEFFAGQQEAGELAGEPWFCAQFKGKKIRDLIVVNTPTEKNIQAVTGATISSEALTDSVREKAEEILRDEQ